MVDEGNAPVLNVSDISGSAYREVAPPDALRPLVECLWSAGRGEECEPADRRILPDGRMDLVWVRGAGTLIAGPQSRFTLRPRIAPLVTVGARFRPGALPGLLRLPAADFVDGHVPLAAVDSGLAGRLEARLDSARSFEQAFEMFGRELLRQRDRIAEPDPAVAEATRILSDPAASVADVATEVYVSERQLRRRFADWVGYGPKTLQRVLRFQRVKAMLQGRAELARAAAAAGYADQAHLSREVRELSGLTPAELARWLRVAR